MLKAKRISVRLKPKIAPVIEYMSHVANVNKSDMINALLAEAAERFNADGYIPEFNSNSNSNSNGDK